MRDAEATHNKGLRKVADSVPHPFSKYELFEKGGSVQGLDNLLHQQTAGRVSHSNNILHTLEEAIVPELEKTEKLLQQRIEHIQGMGNEFNNDLGSGLEKSKESLNLLQQSIVDWEAKNGAVPLDKDPFLVDLTTRKHLRHSLGEESYLRESTLNLEQSAKDLECFVVIAIKKALSQYNDSVSREATELAVMSQKVEQSILAGHLDTEWTFFTKRQYSEGILVDPATSERSLETSDYPGKDHRSTIPICDGWMEKKSKFLNNFATAFYIISPSRYLHEFRSNDLRSDSEPAFSLYLPECEIGATSKEGDAVHKFVLKGTQAGSSLHQDHKWTFRARSRQEMLVWYANIGRASDLAFQFQSTPLQVPQSAASPDLTRTAVAIDSRTTATTLQFDADDSDVTPFKGPETITVPAPATRRPAAGRFDTGGFASAWDAAVVGLNAESSSNSTRRGSVPGRQATTAYGSPADSKPGTPASYPEHDEHLRQASTFSAAANFLDKEILDDNAYLEYDKQHGTHSTLVGDENFKPADADVAISRSNSFHGRIDFRPRRSSSLAFREVAGSPASSTAQQTRKPRPAKVPSRKATATYGDITNLPLPSMTEVNEAVTPEPKVEPYISPYFPAPGAGTTGALPASHFAIQSQTTESVTIIQPHRISTTNSGSNTPNIGGPRGVPSRRMSLSDQILATDSSGAGLADLEPLQATTVGLHDDNTSPYPAMHRFRVPRSRQCSLMATPEPVAEPMEAYDVAPHMRVGTQSNEARYKVGSRRGSRTASQVATPQECLHTGEFDRSALDGLSADSLASKLNEPSQGEKARARRPPSRSASIDLADGAASPAFNVNQRHTFRKPPSRGSSMSLSNPLGGAGDGTGFLNTISEDLAAAKNTIAEDLAIVQDTLAKDYAAAKGNQPGDKHIPGEFPATPATEAPNTFQS